MITIPVITERCAGIDVGKRGLAVAVMKGPADKEASIQTRWVGTTVPELEALRDWLVREGELCLSSSAKSDESLVPFVWAMSADRPT